MTIDANCRAFVFVNVDGTEVTYAFQCHEAPDHTGDHKASGNLAGYEIRLAWPQR